jgi:hypothetical protein
MYNFLYSINKDDLITSLNILWKGLLAMVIVVSIVIIATSILKKIFEEKENK